MTINQSLSHGLEVLLLYDTSTLHFSVSEISQRLGYSQSKTYRIVRTLVKYHLLKENPGTAQYSLGLNALRIGFLAQQDLDLSTIARPFMKELALLIKETVVLTVVSGTKGIVVERVESEEPIRYSLFKPGATIPLHAGASSKILMAYLPEVEWDRIIAKEGLKRYTSNTITDVNQLKVHLREIRKKGYAFSDQEVDQDVRSVSGPILSRKGELMAALSIAGPAYRINKKKISSFSKLIIQYAKKISSNFY